ncbi:hypothetical protein P8S54_10770 [Thiomicrospira sp. R3]|uniref:hypothetical protein n=1 Tax=Thiomicrospira sp. R3 TaxID=3035472 RepID=UPI00259B5F64|nr:hypothetical protein [Thiomicrospira sp. R3]WFE68676.1 hypothetical protein P8S54_10770 [Thiomicrospira sp. R3]
MSHLKITGAVGFFCALVMNSPVVAQWPSIFMSPATQQALEQQRLAFQQGALNSSAPPVEASETLATGVHVEYFTVHAIVTRNGQRLAIINGETYAERTAKKGIRVHRIDADRVTLTLEANEQWGRARLGVTYSLVAWPNEATTNLDIKKIAN